MIRTSLSHPLIIAEVQVGSKEGAVGVTFAPGKTQEFAMTGRWARDLNLDLTTVKAWGASRLISLLEPWEFEELRIPTLPEAAQSLGITWTGLPITDGAAPDDRLLSQWPALCELLTQELLEGARVVVHCKGGLGRAGTVASMLLLETGTVDNASEAMRVVRAVRPGAIETPEQEAFLHQWSPSRSRALDC